jgi:hypothetical protein
MLTQRWTTQAASVYKPYLWETPYLTRIYNRYLLLVLFNCLYRDRIDFVVKRMNGGLCIFQHIKCRFIRAQLNMKLWSYAHTIHIVACLLKARTVKPAETSVVRERLCKHTRCKTMAATDMYATIEQSVGSRVLCAVRAVDQLPLRKGPETTVKWVGGWCEMAPAYKSGSQSIRIECEAGVETGSAGSQSVESCRIWGRGQFGNPEEGTPAVGSRYQAAHWSSWLRTLVWDSDLWMCVSSKSDYQSRPRI